MENKSNKNPLDAAQVRRAVIALKQFVEKKQEEQVKKQLVDTPELISCILTRKSIPSKTSLKPLRIDLPHSFRDDVNQCEMCLIVKTEDKKRIKTALAQDPVPSLTKVLTIQKLKKNYNRFEDRRTLLGAFQLFLVDDRVLPYLKTPLGKAFFQSQKQPVAVRVSRQDVSNPIRRAFRQTQLVVSSGVCSNVRVAHSAMEVTEIVDNILVGMNNCAAHIGKGWNGIQAISIKTNDSVALPVFNALAESAKLPLLSADKTSIKRKLEQVEDDAEQKKTKPNKKPKKETPPAAAAAAANKEQTPEKKASTPNKETSDKKETPAKKVPVKAAQKTPTKDTPAKKTPVKATSAKETTSKTETPAKKSTPAKTTPAKKTPAKTPAKDKETPAKQTTPAKETTPAKASPAKKTTPAKDTPAKKSTPAKTTPAKQTTPAKDKETPAKKTTPAKQTPAKETPAKKTTPAKQMTPAKQTTPAKATPAKKTTPAKETPGKKTTPAKVTSAKKATPAKGTPAKKVTAGKRKADEALQTPTNKPLPKRKNPGSSAKKSKN